MSLSLVLNLATRNPNFLGKLASTKFAFVNGQKCKETQYIKWGGGVDNIFSIYKVIGLNVLLSHSVDTASQHAMLICNVIMYERALSLSYMMSLHVDKQC